MASRSLVELLLVTEGVDEYKSVARQLAKNKIANRTHHAQDGAAALRFVRDWHTEDQTRNLVVLLDANTPSGGLGCLRELRSDMALQTTTVFMLAATEEDLEIMAAYDLDVAGYLLKQDFAPSLIDALTGLESYWHMIIRRT